MILGDLIEITIDGLEVQGEKLLKGIYGIICEIDKRNGIFTVNFNGKKRRMQMATENQAWRMISNKHAMLPHKVISTWEKKAKPVPSEFKGSHNLPIDLDFDDYQEFKPY